MAAIWRPFLVASSLAASCHGAVPGEVEVHDKTKSDDAPLSSAQMHGLHGQIDLNGDGKVSMDEVMQFADEIRAKVADHDTESLIEEIDSNKDGKVSLEEVLADFSNYKEEDEDGADREYKLEVEREKFKAADKNGDGVLDASELPSFFYPETNQQVLDITAQATMKLRDSNKDGKLSLAEFWAAEAGEEGKISDEEAADFKAVDTNNDGALDLEELKHWESGRYATLDAMKKMFEIADKDKDGHITAHELDSAKEGIAGSDAQAHLEEWVGNVEL